MDAVSTLPMLATIWFLIIGLFLMFYVVLDGFDLGVGILSMFVKEEARRGVMMNSLGTVWDANETWIVIVGGTLFGAFPLAFGVVFHALYIPMLLMLFGLIFRGVAFEFRHLAQRESIWEWAFGFGSLVAAGAQGLALGGLLQGPTVEQGRFTGGTFDWLTPFSLLTTGGVLVGYTLLGTTYLMIRMHGMLEDRLYRLARYLAVAMLAVAAAVSLWCPLRYAWIFDRWFSLPNVYYYATLPALALFAFAMLFRSLAQRRTVAPFVWTLLIFVASFAGLGATFFPYLVPEGISGAGFTPEDREKIDEDERRVFDMLTPNFTFFTTETPVKEGPVGEVAVFSFHARKPGMTREEFDDRYHGEHAQVARDMVGSLAGLTRYMLNRPVQDPLPLFPFDGITEGWYETEDDAIRALTGSELDPVRRDLGLFCDPGAGVIMLTRPCHRWSQP